LLIGPGRLADNYVDAHARKVGEVMTETVVAVAPQTELPDIVQLMEACDVKRVPVIEDGRLVRIVSRANLVRALVHKLAEEAAATAGCGFSDTKIRSDILAIIERQPWGPRFSVTVGVRTALLTCGAQLPTSVNGPRLKSPRKPSPASKACTTTWSGSSRRPDWSFPPRAKAKNNRQGSSKFGPSLP